MTRPAREKQRRRRRLARWPRRVATSVEVRWTGGAESWWRIKFRGEEFRVPGHMCIEDVFARVFNEL